MFSRVISWFLVTGGAELFLEGLTEFFSEIAVSTFLTMIAPLLWDRLLLAYFSWSKKCCSLMVLMVFRMVDGLMTVGFLTVTSLFSALWNLYPRLYAENKVLHVMPIISELFFIGIGFSTFSSILVLFPRKTWFLASKLAKILGL